MRKGIFMSAIGLLLSVLLAACSAPTQKPSASQSETPTRELSKVSFGLPVGTAVDFIPVFIGKGEGFFAKRGLDISVTSFTGGPKLQQAVAAGDIQVGVDNVTGLGLAIIKGAPIRIVAMTSGKIDPMVLIVSKQSGVEKLSDLKGKTIGVTAHGAVTDWLAKQIAKSQGWDVETGLVRVPLGGLQEQLAALKSGQTVGFVFTAEPAFGLEEKGEGKILLKFGEILPDYAFMTIEAHTDFMKNHPEQLRAVVEGWFEAVAFMKANREKSIEYIMKEMNHSRYVAEKAYDMTVKGLSDDGVPNRKAFEGALNSLVELNGLKQGPRFEEVFAEGLVPVKR